MADSKFSVSEEFQDIPRNKLVPGNKFLQYPSALSSVHAHIHRVVRVQVPIRIVRRYCCGYLTPSKIRAIISPTPPHRQCAPSPRRLRPSGSRYGHIKSPAHGLQPVHSGLEEIHQLWTTFIDTSLLQALRNPLVSLTNVTLGAQF
jgi:hypothetical protein